MAYLDDTGLAYFWGKIKAWCNNIFLKLTGGTVTGDIKISGNGRLVLDVSSETPTSGVPRNLPLVLKSKSAGTGYDYSKVILHEAPTTQSYANGSGISLGGGGLTIVGGGESAVDIISAENLDGSDEKVVITSDYDIEFFTNCNTIANRVKTTINSSGAFSGSAAKLTTARKLKTKLDSTADATFDGSAAQEAIPVTGVLPVANGGTGSSTKNFVDLTSSQSIAGNKTFTGTTYLSENTRGPLGDAGLNITGGSTYYAGARLRLNGVSDSGFPGGFNLVASIDQNTQKWLSGSTDGTLTWNNKDITGDVHLDTDETITGSKYFTKVLTVDDYIYLRHSSVQQGVLVNGNKYRDFAFSVLNVAGTNNVRDSYIEKAWYTDGGSRLSIVNVDYIDPTRSYASIVVGHDSNGIPYTNAIDPPAASNSTNIATTKWVRTFCDTTKKYVDSSSNQTAGGEKTFASTVIIANNSPFVRLKDTNGIKGNASDGWYVSNEFVDKNNARFGFIGCGKYGAASDVHNNIVFTVYNCGTTANDYFEVRAIFYSSNNNTNIIRAFEPDGSDRVLLGRSSRKWQEIWCSQSSINSSSDERIKDDIESIPDAVLDAWLGVDWVQYRFKSAKAGKGEAARFHTGAVAQRIDEAFRGAGLDASRYGLFLHDVWDAVPDAFDENGVQTQKAQPAGDEYGLRYVEALCMEAACMRRENARLKKRVADLEERLAALELKIA